MDFPDYKKYRWFFTSSGKLVVGGKSAEQNDSLLSTIKSSFGNKDVLVMHTAAPGSPFSIILEERKNVTKDDLEETAIFTASFSRAWKSGKKNSEVDIFSLSQVSKSFLMKTGTWGVAGEVMHVQVPLELVFTIQQDTLRAVPEKSVKRITFPSVKLVPGKVDKTEMVEKIRPLLDNKFSADEILAALPAGGVSILSNEEEKSSSKKSAKSKKAKSHKSS